MRTTIPLAIVGIAALAGCASPSAPQEAASPSPSTRGSAPAPSPSAPSPSASGDATQAAAQPFRIEDESLLGAYSLDDVPGDEPLVAWADAERTLVHVIGAGSGSEPCQPTGESIELDDGVLEIEFDAADPATACTDDRRVFGWAFPVAAVDASVTQARVDGWSEAVDDLTVPIQPAANLR